jgi:tetratricopeptide (TPR) repeat protein
MVLGLPLAQAETAVSVPKAIALRLDKAVATLEKHSFDPADKTSYPIAAPALDYMDKMEIQDAMTDLGRLLADPEAAPIVARTGVAYALAALCLDRPELVTPLFSVHDYKGGLNDEQDLLLLIANARLGRTEEMKKIRVEIVFGGMRGGETLTLDADQERRLSVETELGRFAADLAQAPTAEKYRTRAFAYLKLAGIDFETLGKFVWLPPNWTPAMKRYIDLAGRDLAKAADLGMKYDDAMTIASFFYSLGHGNVEGAREKVEAIVKANPQSPMAWFLTAILQSEMGLYAAAVKTLDMLTNAGVPVDPGFKAAIVGFL